AMIPNTFGRSSSMTRSRSLILVITCTSSPGLVSPPQHKKSPTKSSGQRVIDTYSFVTYFTVSMKSFKRNQIEEAISRLFGEKSAKPSSELQTRIKRLLDLDRSLPRNSRSKRPELANYAFYSSESPGKGAEVSFSSYEAFAIMIGLQMLNH